jgi:hypothetical protein
MTPDGSTDTSASSRAEFTGIMVVDTVATTPGKPKTLYITGAFYTTLGIVMGIFRYFNQYNYVLEPKSRWFTNTTVSLSRFSVLFPTINGVLGLFIQCGDGF